LKPKTLARVEYGFETFGQKPMIVTGRYTTGMESRVRDAMQDVIPTQPGDSSHAVVMPWIVETGYDGDERSRCTDRPLMTQTARQSAGLVSPGFIAELHGTSTASALSDPLMCVTASGNHHALLSSNAFLTYYYGNSTTASAITDPVNTVTGLDRAGLAQGSDKMTVDDLTFRMLHPREIGKAMAFPATYTVKGNHRETVKQYGNAVTPPVMKMLIDRCVTSLL